MMYIIIFIVSYAVAFLIAFYFISRNLHHASSSMREMGMGDREVREYYQMMKNPTYFALLQATLITGSFIGCIGSIIAYVFR